MHPAAFALKSWVKEHPASWLRERPALLDLVTPVARLVWRSAAYRYLDQLSRKSSQPLRFIQIGANDGVRNDPVREFIVRDRWRGVLVEPLPYAFEKLQQNYPSKRFPGLHFLNAAISDRSDAALEFWTFSNEFLGSLSFEQRLDYLRKSSFARSHVERYLPRSSSPDRALARIRVPCMSMSSIADRYFDEGQFDLLVIDAEGHEQTILNSLDLTRTRPRAIVFESEHLDPSYAQLSARLSAAGYHVSKLGARDSVAELVQN